jgi:hypothetical protein
VTFFVVQILGRHDRVSEYLALSFVAAIVAIVVGAAFPAVGAPTYLEAPKSLMEAFAPRTGAQWVQQLTDLRNGVSVDIGQGGGLISFPSYHVALSMIVAWSLRGVRFAFPVGVIFAVGTVASAPIFGGHYFVDLIAGAVLVCVLVGAGGIRRTLAIAPAPIRDPA